MNNPNNLSEFDGKKFLNNQGEYFSVIRANSITELIVKSERTGILRVATRYNILKTGKY